MSLFDAQLELLNGVEPVSITGRVSAVRGLSISVADFPAPVGSACRLHLAGRVVEARVIGFAGDQTLVMPLGTTAGVRRGDRAVSAWSDATVGVGEAVLGRVLNGLGVPIDGGPAVAPERRMPLWPEPIPPLARGRVGPPLATGIRAVDAMLTVGCGQRMAVLSGPGVGKSVLLGMIARWTSADVIVVGLIGERGREVREFIERELGAEGMRRSVVVASTSDEPPLMRVQAAGVAAAVAEFFRDRGRHVLLLVDSLTRLAAAQRQIGLAAGEPPTVKGYTPSVFSLLPQLLERGGRTEAGSVTGFYAALVESEDPADPVCDAVRACTDGHLWLSRGLANRGHYPAIDVLTSVSRAMTDISDPRHLAGAAQLRRLMALYAEVEELLNVGAYQSGGSAEHDLAIAAMPHIQAFLAQGLQEPSSIEQTVSRLGELQELIDRLRQEPASADPSKAQAA